MRDRVPRLGLKTPFHGRTLREVGRDILALAEAGLKRRARRNDGGEDETRVREAYARLGVLAGYRRWFRNGGRVADAGVRSELRAGAGATPPLVADPFTPDGAATAIEDGTFPPNRAFLDVFPYLGVPYAGYDVPAA